MKRKPSDLPESLRADGVIRFDIFDLTVPLYTSDKRRVKALKWLGCDATTAPFPVLGLVGKDAEPDGTIVLSVVITPEADLAVWAHEAVHLADLTMESRGIPTDAENTEIRAYLTGHAVSQISEIMAEIARNKSQKNQKKKPSTKGN